MLGQVIVRSVELVLQTAVDFANLDHLRHGIQHARREDDKQVL